MPSLLSVPLPPLLVGLGVMNTTSTTDHIRTALQTLKNKNHQRMVHAQGPGLARPRRSPHTNNNYPSGRAVVPGVVTGKVGVRIGLRSGSGAGSGGGGGGDGLRIDVRPIDVSEDSLEQGLDASGQGLGLGVGSRFDERGMFGGDEDDDDYDDETFYDEEGGFVLEDEGGGGGDASPNYALNDSAARELRALGFAVTSGQFTSVFTLYFPLV